jgi:hypothetical protein
MFNFHLIIFSHWRHIFILLSIYFFRSAMINYSYGYKRTGYFTAMWGLIIALVVSLLLGSIPVNEIRTRIMLGGLLVPISGIFLFDLGRQVWITTFSRNIIADRYRVPHYSWWEYFKPNLILCLGQAIGSAVCVSIYLSIPFVKSSQSPILFSMALLILSIAIYRICLGIMESPKLRKEDSTKIAAFLRTHSAGLALSILSLLFWLFIFLITSAGLQFYDL